MQEMRVTVGKKKQTNDIFGGCPVEYPYHHGYNNAYK